MQNMSVYLCVHAGEYATEDKPGCWGQPSALFESGSLVVFIAYTRLAVPGRSVGITDACY